MSLLRFLALPIALSMWTVAASASADPLVEQGVAAYEDAHFSEALELFADAEQTDALTTSDVEQLLLHRALCHYALGDGDAFRRELNKLARLTPGFALGASIPPRVRDAFAELEASGDGLELEVQTHRVRSGVRVVARVTGDPGGLVRQIRVQGNTASGDTIHGDGPEVNVPAAADEEVRYRAVVIGPGGALLRESEGSYLEPPPSVADAPPPNLAIVSEDPAEDEASIWPWVAVGGGVLAVATVVAIVLFATASTETQFGPPEVR